MTEPSRPPSLLYATLRVCDLSLGEMLWSRRTVFMALVVGLPVLMSVIVRLLYEAGAPGLRVGAAGGPVVFGIMVWVFFVRFCVPVLGVFYGTSLIADEVEDKTITYLFTRPIPRGAVLLGKYLAYVICTVFVVLPAVVLVWLLVVPMGGSLGATFGDLVKDLGILALGLLAYGAFFSFIGATVKRPLLVGLLFVFGWEMIALALPGYMKRITIAYYLQGLVPHTMPSNSPVGLMQSVFRESPTLTTSLVGIGVIVLVALWLGSRAVTNREYVLEQ
jgi:ABC-type transport system involved in multi-copper enzyme maturation permease subunit